GVVVDVAHGPDAMDGGLRQRPVADGANDFRHVAAAPVRAAENVAELDAVVLGPDVDRPGEAAVLALEDDPRERPVSGPAGCAVPEVFARLGGAQMRPKAHVSCGLGIARVRREDRLRVVHDGRSQPEPGGLESRGRLHESRLTTMLPVAATVKLARGPTTRVEPSSSITAGPANRSPTARASSSRPRNAASSAPKSPRSSRIPTVATRSTRAGATSRPSAEATPADGGQITRLRPSLRATWQAWTGPAPPVQRRA